MTSSGSSEKTPQLTNNKAFGPSSSSGASQGRPSGKLVFGSGSGNIPADSSAAFKVSLDSFSFTVREFTLFNFLSKVILTWWI